MPRIPDDLLERIKAEIPVLTLAERAGVELKPHGENLLGRCMWHDDKTPSLVLTPSKNLWHCMGACQIGGSPIDWVMKAEGISFRHAVEVLLADFFPLDARRLAAGPSGPPPKRSTVRTLALPVEPEASDEEIKRQVVGYYHETLKETPEALAYLESRGLKSAEMVDRFKLGYSNRTLGLRIPLPNRKTGFEIRSRLQRLGILRESGHELFWGSLVVPILGEGGEGSQVLGIYGRKIRDDLRLGTPLHLYLPGPHRGVFNIEALQASKEVILCEALVDALTFWCAGFRNVTASYGVEGFTHDHLAAFKAYGTEHVLIAYDRDDAGDRAAEALSKKLMAEGIACSRVLFPKGMDANGYALKVQPAEKSLGVLLRSAEWIGGPPRRAHETTVPVAAISTKATKEESGRAAKEENIGGLVTEEAPTASASSRVDRFTQDETGSSSTPKAGAALVAPEVSSRTSTTSALPSDDETVILLGDRRYRVRGLSKNLSFGALRLNLLVSRESAEGLFDASPLAGFHVDTLDLYVARQRAGFEKQAARELGVTEEVIKKDLGHLLRRLEELQEKSLRKALEPAVKTVSLNEGETKEALDLLRDPNLLDRILCDFQRCGIVGERTNKLTAYLAAVSRKLERPLAVIIQSSSAAGKSSLMEAVLAFMPEEEREKYSALTGMSLFYFSDAKSLKHKILAIVEEEGAEKATYALKLLQSEGELSIASTGKDPQTGRLVTQEYRVEGPVMIFLTTTAVSIDEELLNRCLVLTVDENREQTRAIHQLQRQRETIEGLLVQQERQRIEKLHKNAQRLLRPLLVANPFAERLTFLDDRTRTRRDHVKYLTLIRTVALLHQYQRPTQRATCGGSGNGDGGTSVEYIEATLQDVAVANELAGEVLGRSLDELPPQTRRLLLLVEQMVAGACETQGVGRSDLRFSRKDVRDFTSWGNTQLKLHLLRLEDMEYLLAHRGGRGQSFVYELLYDGRGQDGRPFLPGLIDAESLGRSDVLEAISPSDRVYDRKKSGVEVEKSGSGRPQVGGVSGDGRVMPMPLKPALEESLCDIAPETDEKSLLGAVAKTQPYTYTQPRADGGHGGNESVPEALLIASGALGRASQDAAPPRFRLRPVRGW
jgi:DNA primase catalytic core